jgi:uncharacterized Zn finger protein (UPF0148 family)
MSTTCALIALNCPYCRSTLVRVIGPGQEDRAICPICWASATFEEANKGAESLKRGERIDPKVK